jgi:ABC-type polysaccharide/polyol phosphate export permease
VLPFIELIRVPILDNHVPPLRTIGMAGIITIGTIIVAGVLLNRLGKRLIFHL